MNPLLQACRDLILEFYQNVKDGKLAEALDTGQRFDLRSRLFAFEVCEKPELEISDEFFIGLPNVLKSAMVLSLFETVALDLEELEKCKST